MAVNKLSAKQKLMILMKKLIQFINIMAVSGMNVKLL